MNLSFKKHTNLVLSCKQSKLTWAKLNRRGIYQTDSEQFVGGQRSRCEATKSGTMSKIIQQNCTSEVTSATSTEQRYCSSHWGDTSDMRPEHFNHPLLCLLTFLKPEFPTVTGSYGTDFQSYNCYIISSALVLRPSLVAREVERMSVCLFLATVMGGEFCLIKQESLQIYSSDMRPGKEKNKCP